MDFDWILVFTFLDGMRGVQKQLERPSSGWHTWPAGARCRCSLLRGCAAQAVVRSPSSDAFALLTVRERKTYRRSSLPSSKEMLLISSSKAISICDIFMDQQIVPILYASVKFWFLS